MNCQAVSVRQLDQILESGFRGLVVDVRSPADYGRGHIRGAVNIPCESFEDGNGGLPMDRVIIFYCAHGGQSMRICARLARQGYRTVNLVGGIDQYRGKYLER